MNLILALDTAKMLNHEFVEPCITNQFYLRARNDVYFVGLRAMINKYFSKPITQSDIDEAEDVMRARGQYCEAKFMRWQYILSEHGGYLPITIRSVAEGSFVEAGRPILVVELNDSQCSWATYAVDSLILRSIWYPSSLATRLMQLKKDLNWSEAPCFVYDIAGRSAECDESSQIAAATTKMVFESYDSIQGDMYLWKHYDQEISKPFNPVYLNEHNHVLGWKGEHEFYYKLAKLSPGSVAVCLVDTYDMEQCLALIQSFEIQSLVNKRSISLYVCPDSLETSTELKAIHDRVRKTSTGLVVTGLDSSLAKELSKMGLDEGRMMFTLEDSMLREGLSRRTYGFEYKQCAVKREEWARWEPVSKKPALKPDLHTLSGLQFPEGAETVYISGFKMDLDGIDKISKRLV